MPIVVRLAEAADADLLGLLNNDVQAVHAAALPALFKPPDPQAFAAEARRLLEQPEHFFLIAELDGEAAGYAYAQIVEQLDTPFRHPRRLLFLHHLSVRPALQRRGVGRALIDAMRASARERELAAVLLDVWIFNESARAFFRRCGFTAFNERMASG